MYRFVNCEKSYNIGNDAMRVKCMPGENHIFKGVINFDYVRLSIIAGQIVVVITKINLYFILSAVRNW